MRGCQVEYGERLAEENGCLAAKTFSHYEVVSGFQSLFDDELDSNPRQKSPGRYQGMNAIHWAKKKKADEGAMCIAISETKADRKKTRFI
ncbi:hypothetical protein PoB_004996300 [Plakobranchus ocellatus]|uniref:Uncharacterized protein n=1 Tax=Plakobranchus ocellatus TaxID=259542 RepID=A0AAV4BXD4_9GAST|nr:hypothetical protein PoB_004996300 [Plakobranchus ocellatus]